jgi:hypothetical protein
MPLIIFVSSSLNIYVNLPKKRKELFVREAHEGGLIG